MEQIVHGPKRMKRGGGARKFKRFLKHKANGKYDKQFARTVKRTGKWRGRKVD